MKKFLLLLTLLAGGISSSFAFSCWADQKASCETLKPWPEDSFCARWNETNEKDPCLKPYAGGGAEREALLFNLSCAACAGNWKKALPLIDKANVGEWPDTFTLNSTFYRAAKERNYEVMELLIDKGLDINFAMAKGGIEDSNSVLKEAVCWGDIDLVKFLVENGADIHLDERLYHSSILEVAQKCSNEEIINFLKEQGAKSYKAFTFISTVFIVLIVLSVAGAVIFGLYKCVQILRC